MKIKYQIENNERIQGITSSVYRSSTHNASKKTLEMILTAENVSIAGPFCDEFSFRLHKQLSTKDYTTRKMDIMTNSLENRRTNKHNFRFRTITWSPTLLQIFLAYYNYLGTSSIFFTSSDRCKKTHVKF